MSLYKSPILRSSFCELLADVRLHEGIPRASTNWRLSSISEIRGITTKVTPVSVTAESWKVRLLPPPVGMRARTFFPLLVALMISLWFSRKPSLPKMC